jgi:hypothetical protein
MIPKKHSGRGSGACAVGGEHPVYCSGCGQRIKKGRGAVMSQSGRYDGMPVVGQQMCQRCRTRGGRKSQNAGLR